VLKLIPAGVALMAKLAIAPPVEVAIVNPVAAVSAVRVSDELESVKTGAASAGADDDGEGEGAGSEGAGAEGAGAEGAGAEGAGEAEGVAVVIDSEIAETDEEPAAFIAVNVNV
jgi:hypothetical protein